ncbi:MAG TPA: CHAD domain-containing protein [Nitrososphaera sp.]
MKQSSFYDERFSRGIEKLREKLAAYLDDPDDKKNVHDVRTAIRRLEVMFSLLPKKMRKRNRKKINEYREFFKANSVVRDLDVIRGRVAALSPDASLLDLQLQSKRNAELQHAIQAGRKIKNIRLIRVYDVQPRKLEARIDKITDRLSARIEQTLPAVLSDSGKVEELHGLRKDCKKLRYVIEALPSGIAKKYEKKASDAIGKRGGSISLEKLQDMLGEIRDSDITLQYLETSKSKIAGELASIEATVRQQLYDEFVKYANQASC